MLAVADRFQRECRSDIGIAGSVDDDIDMSGGGKRGEIGRDGDLACFDSAVDIRWFAGNGNVVEVAACDEEGLTHASGVDFGDGTEPQAGHQRDLHDEIGAHLAGARQADGHRAMLLGIGREIGGKRRNIRYHSKPCASSWPSCPLAGRDAPEPEPPLHRRARAGSAACHRS